MSMGADHGAVGLVRQNLQEHGVGHATVNDVHGVDATLGSVQRTADLGQHAAADGAVGKKFINFTGTQVGEQLARLVQYAWGVGQEHELLGTQHSGQSALIGLVAKKRAA